MKYDDLINAILTSAAERHFGKKGMSRNN